MERTSSARSAIALAGTTPDSLGRLLMQPGTFGARQRGVGDVADQLMPEGKAAGLGSGRSTSSALRRSDQSNSTRASPSRSSRAPARKAGPSTEAYWIARLSFGRKQVESRGDRGLDGLREAFAGRLTVLHEPARHLLGEEGLPLRGVGDPPRRRAGRIGQEELREAGRVDDSHPAAELDLGEFRAERPKPERRSSELGPAGAEQEDREPQSG